MYFGFHLWFHCWSRRVVLGSVTCSSDIQWHSYIILSGIQHACRDSKWYGLFFLSYLQYLVCSWCAVITSDHMLFISVSHRLYGLSSGIPSSTKSIPIGILWLFLCLLMLWTLLSRRCPVFSKSYSELYYRDLPRFSLSNC